MTQVVVEETIMAVAKWLVNLVNRTLETKSAPSPEPPPSASAAAAPPSPAAPSYGEQSGTGEGSTVDQLLTKFSGLLEQSCDRTGQIALLESRLQALEAASSANQNWEESIQTLSQAVVKLNSRLSQVERALEQVDMGAIATDLAATVENEAQLQQWAQSTEEQVATLAARLTAAETALEIVGRQNSSTLNKISQTLQDTTTLPERVAHLEKIVARLSAVPKFVENNYRSIISLQDYMRKLHKAPATNGHRSQD
ncbi:MAG TPA: hypothetical protein V6D06_06805 [Trichocoleus sp.]